MEIIIKLYMLFKLESLKRFECTSDEGVLRSAGDGASWSALSTMRISIPNLINFKVIKRLR